MRIDNHRDEYLKADAEGKAKLLCKTYGVPPHMVWKHSQSGKYIITHAGVEMVAALESIIVDYREVSMAPEFIVILATPRSGDDSGQATYGEASPKNTMQKHPVAMAEKRAYDRAVLKFVLKSVGGYGADFYSEEESDDFRKDAAPAPARGTGKTRVTIANSVEDYCRRLAGITDPDTVDAVLAEMGKLDNAANKDWFKSWVAPYAAKCKTIMATKDNLELDKLLEDADNRLGKLKDKNAGIVLAMIKERVEAQRAK